MDESTVLFLCLVQIVLFCCCVYVIKSYCGFPFRFGKKMLNQVSSYINVTMIFQWENYFDHFWGIQKRIKMHQKIEILEQYQHLHRQHNINKSQQYILHWWCPISRDIQFITHISCHNILCRAFIHLTWAFILHLHHYQRYRLHQAWKQAFQTNLIFTYRLQPNIIKKQFLFFYDLYSH